MRTTARIQFAATVALLTGMAPWSHAAEQLTLRNGFQMRCDHYAATGSTVRIYLNAGEDNYIELPQQEIVSAQPLAEPAQPKAPPAPAPRSDTLTRTDLGQILSRAGQAHNLDVDLLASVVHAESGGNAHAVSRAGARGLMQLMPGTAANLGVKDSFQPDQNVRGGSAYLDALLTRYHDNLALALAAYNAGPEAVDRYHGIPPYRETRAYVARVIHEFNHRVRTRESQAHQPVTLSSQSVHPASAPALP